MRHSSAKGTSRRRTTRGGGKAVGIDERADLLDMPVIVPGDAIKRVAGKRFQEIAHAREDEEEKRESVADAEPKTLPAGKLNRMIFERGEFNRPDEENPQDESRQIDRRQKTPRQHAGVHRRHGDEVRNQEGDDALKYVP